MKEPKISIIIPVYNVEKYLKRCIKSVLNQDYKNLEIYLVDDGSTDNSGNLCDYYAEIDNRIKVIHKTNGGLSSARNAALEKVSGKYLTFIDSDDYVAKNYISILYKTLYENEAQISVCCELRFKLDNSNKEIFYEAPYKKYEGVKALTIIEGLRTMMTQELFDASAWGKLYLSSLFENVRYPEGINHEDIGTTFKVFCISNKIAFNSKCLYYYFQREGSILNQRNTKTLWDGIDMVEYQKNEIMKIYPELIEACDCRCFSMYCHVIKEAINSEDVKLIKYSWDKIKQLRGKIILQKNSRKKAKIAAVLSFLGNNMFIKICSII